MAAGEDKKPELKTKPKEEDVSSGTPVTPAGIPNKKKRKNIFHKEIYIQDILKMLWLLNFMVSCNNPQ